MAVAGGWAALPRALFGPRRLGLYVAGAGIGNLGRWFLQLATSVLTYQLTESTLLVGLVSVSQFLPAILFAPWTGRVADRFDRRRVIWATQTGSSILVGLLALASATGHVTVGVVLSIGFCVGVLQAFQAPASLALTPSLVEPELRDVAVSLNSIQFNLARAVGPAVGAVVIAKAGLANGLFANCLLFFVFAACLFGVRPREQARPAGQSTMRGAFTELRRSEHALMLLLTGAFISGTSDAVNTLGPALAAELTGSPADAGLLVSAFGVGAVTYGLVVQPVLRHVERQLATLMALQAAGLLLMAAAPTLPFALAGAALSGAGFLGASTRANTRLQSLTPPEMLGRVMALWTVALLGVRPFFSLIIGLTADLFTPAASALASALTLSAFAAAFHLHLRTHRKPA